MIYEHITGFWRHRGPLWVSRLNRYRKPKLISTKQLQILRLIKMQEYSCTRVNMGVLNDVLEITGWTSVGSHYINTCVAILKKTIPSFIDLFYFKDTTQTPCEAMSCISLMPKPTRLHQSVLVSVMKFRKS